MSTGAQTPKIIVSYRRTDSAMAGRIFDRLVQRFGKKSLFIDIDNIPFGGDFRKHIDDALKSSDLLIALVGAKWVGGEGKDAKITRDADPVRVEIETALKQNVPVLPVLLDEARMPEPSELPENIREFAYRNAAEVESGRDFDIHVDRLIKAVEQILGAKVAPQASAASESATLVSPGPVAPPGTKRFPMPLFLGGALVALAGLAAAVWFAHDRISVDPTTGTAYCADLKKVMVEARRDFTSIMGREVSKVIWTARIQLPGWDNCIVSDWTTQGKIIRYYGCEIPSVPTAEEMHAKRDTAVSYLESCLGKDWIKTRVGNETNFELGSNDPIGRIRETAYTDGRGNILRIEVDVPSSLIRAAPAEAVSDKPAPTPPQPANQAETYCEDMKRAVATAPSNFAAILGGAFIGAGPAKKGDLSPIGTPGRRAGAIRQTGQLARLAAGQIDCVDLCGIAGAIRAECQPPAIGTPAWRGIALRAGREAPRRPTVGGHQPDRVAIAVAYPVD
jgi:hypothetical protein